VRQLILWCEKVGLPTKLRYFGELTKPALKMAAEYASEKDPSSKNMPEKMKPANVLEAIEKVERGTF